MLPNSRRVRRLSASSSDGTPPNFRTLVDPDALLRGFGSTVTAIYTTRKNIPSAGELAGTVESELERARNVRELIPVPVEQ